MAGRGERANTRFVRLIGWDRPGNSTPSGHLARHRDWGHIPGFRGAREGVMRRMVRSGGTARRVIVAVAVVVASLAADTIGVSAAAGAATDTTGLPPQKWTSLVATPIASPRPVLGADGRVHLVYELLVMNVSPSAMTLERLETLDASKGDAGNKIVATSEGSVLEEISRSFTNPLTLTVGPFQTTRLFLDATFDKNATVPKVLEHRFQFTLTPAAGVPPVTSATVGRGRTKVSNARGGVIGPPLKGSRWVAAIGCCSPPSVHRTATLPINGKIRATERFAIDFAQLAPDNKFLTGPRAQP